MRIVEIVLTTISWMVSVFMISAVCNYYDCEWAAWVLVCVVGFLYGKYLYEQLK